MATLATARSASLAKSFTIPHWSVWCLSLAVLLGATLQTQLSEKPGELSVYLKAAARLQTGEMFYRTDDGPAFSYPPFFAFVFVPLTWLPVGVVDFVWNTINLGLITGCIWLVRSFVRPLLNASQMQWWSSWSIVVVVLSLRFILSPLEYRCHDSIILFCSLWGLSCLLQKREMECGLWCGLATACKATPLLFLPVLLLQRRWRASAAFVITLGLASWLPDLCYPAHSGGAWAIQWYQVFVSKVDTAGPAEAEGAWKAWNPLNQSLSGTLYRLTTAPSEEFAHLKTNWLPVSTAARRVLTLVAVASVFIGTLWMSMRYVNSQASALALTAGWSAVLCAMLLLSPMSSKQHFCYLMLPIATLSACYFQSPFPSSRFQQRLLCGGLCGMFLLGTCLAKDIVGKTWGDYAQACGSLTACALLSWGLSLYVLAKTEQIIVRPHQAP
jgi:hypothetical protein